jgi:hypothetical protein
VCVCLCVFALQLYVRSRKPRQVFLKSHLCVCLCVFALHMYVRSRKPRQVFLKSHVYSDLYSKCSKCTRALTFENVQTITQRTPSSHVAAVPTPSAGQGLVISVGVGGSAGGRRSAGEGLGAISGARVVGEPEIKVGGAPGNTFPKFSV